MGKTDTMLKTALDQPEGTRVLIIGLDRRHCTVLMHRLLQIEAQRPSPRTVDPDSSDALQVALRPRDLRVTFRGLHSGGAYWDVHRNVRVLIDHAAIPTTLVQLIRRNAYVGS